jgi:hypothetical protein
MKRLKLFTTTTLLLTLAITTHAQWTQATKFLAPDEGRSLQLGHSVFIDGDYAIVGVYRDDDKGLS